MGLLIAYRDSCGSICIHGDFDDTLEAGLARKRGLAEKEHDGAVLFDVGLDENLGNYFAEGPIFWDFIKAHEVKDEGMTI
ncbi:MAG: hypothetical protein HDQ88_05820 [Clostridia bacterium]|nr:hypothetical protein [Clostridia bacterium]